MTASSRHWGFWWESDEKYGGMGGGRGRVFERETRRITSISRRLCSDRSRLGSGSEFGQIRWVRYGGYVLSMLRSLSKVFLRERVSWWGVTKNHRENGKRILLAW